MNNKINELTRETLGGLHSKPNGERVERGVLNRIEELGESLKGLDYSGVSCPINSIGYSRENIYKGIIQGCRGFEKSAEKFDEFCSGEEEERAKWKYRKFVK